MCRLRGQVCSSPRPGDTQRGRAPGRPLSRAVRHSPPPLQPLSVPPIYKDSARDRRASACLLSRLRMRGEPASGRHQGGGRVPRPCFPCCKMAGVCGVSLAVVVYWWLVFIETVSTLVHNPFWVTEPSRICSKALSGNSQTNVFAYDSVGFWLTRDAG